MQRDKYLTDKIPLYRKEGFILFLITLPFMMLLFVLSYLPLYGWAYAFLDYKPGMSLFEAPFAGLKYFHMLVQDKYAIQDILRVLRNTFVMNLFSYLFSLAPLAFAIFLSDIRGTKFKKIVQTTTTLPHFISWVLVYAVAYSIFSVNDGLLNKLLLNAGIIDAGINFLVIPDYSWLKMALWGLWKNLGWSAIIYFAAISGIDQELYEAASVDGAKRFRRMWHITLPQLIPTFFVLLILSIASFLNTGMESFYVFSNSMNRKYLEVLDLFVYNLNSSGF